MGASGARLLVLPRDEMAFRKAYQPLLVDRSLTTVFRPGDRRYPAWRGYAEGEKITARVISRPGCDARGIAPRFNTFRATVRIGEVRVLPVAALTPADFAGSSPDVVDPPSLLAHLLAIYGRPIEAYGGIVTHIRFTYIDPAPARR
jgi:hypothetical protein